MNIFVGITEIHFVSNNRLNRPAANEILTLQCCGFRNSKNLSVFRKYDPLFFIFLPLCNGRKWPEQVDVQNSNAFCCEGSLAQSRQSAKLSLQSSELGLSRQRVCPFPRTKGGGHTRLRVRGWRNLNSNDWIKSLALCLLCAGPY